MLEIRNLTKNYGEFKIAGVNLTVQKNDYFVILGMSGAGKTLLLELIAGLVIPDEGEISLEGRNITHEKIQKRQVGMVFQDHAIFPHMSVRENIAFGLSKKMLNKRDFTSGILKLTDEMSISHLLDRKPATLSGGELQRVVLARTLASHPKLLLLDEPLASLDVQIRSDMRKLLRQIHQSGQTIIHVTHDYEEAISLATRVAVINKGAIIQAGGAEEVFHHPKSAFVANFTGIKNFFPVTLIRSRNYPEEKTVEAKVHDQLSIYLLTDSSNMQGFIMIRGEDIIISNAKIETSAVNCLQATITDIHPGIHGMELHIDCGIDLVAVISKQSLTALNLYEGKNIWISFKASAVKYLEN
ncbi:MAG: ABC transporter ATP-binding protein [Bacteroidetes bacterium]|nr:ABC transporter ATP-binding protein [Bacteroidota bacterium]